MKKFILLCLGLAMCLVISACGVLSERPEVLDKETDDLEETTITYASAAFDHMTQDEVIESFKEKRIDDVIANDDGSYTITMPKVFHERILNSIKDEVADKLETIVKNQDVNAIKEMMMNDAMTELIVVIDQSVPEEDLENSVLDEFANYAFNYQMHSGVMLEDFTYDIVSVDDETGEEIDRRSGIDNWEK